MVLYRKYRPQKLSELDSDEVRTRLAAMLSSSHMPHAFLFTGPKGTGKTSSARIIAKILNCEKKKEALGVKRKEEDKKDIDALEPCNNCEACINITEGRFLDVLEIDAASNRGIDEIRTLRDSIKLAPVAGKYKIYIVDEVHMLTNEAFNALLKTLEEPPKHSMFILATTEAEKLPETIVSRTVHIPFSRATQAELLRSLTRVVKGEKLQISPETLEKIAGRADGSFRDATKLLEQLVAELPGGADDKSGSEAALSSILGERGIQPQQCLMLLAGKKTQEILIALQKGVQEGMDIRMFVAGVLRLLHIRLLSLHGIKSDGVKDVVTFGKEDTLALLRLFTRVYAEVRTASNPVIPLEVAIVEWTEK